MLTAKDSSTVGHELTKLCRDILNIIQGGFPLEKNPYDFIGDAVGTDAASSLAAISSLRKSGIIRRIGGVFVSARLGYTARLCCGRLAESQLPLYTEYTSAITAVTHNYVRNHSYNIWFTVIGESDDAAGNTVALIEKNTGLKDIKMLKALKQYKIRTYFSMNDKAMPLCEPQAAMPDVPPVLDLRTKRIIGTVQGDLPCGTRPYKEWGEVLGLSEDELIACIKEMKESGLMRRFGAILRHQRAGYTENAMIVFSVPHEEADRVAETLIKYDEVSHCYEREAFADFPYTLYAMVHARSPEEMQSQIAKLSSEAGDYGYVVLKSEKELKKTSMKYFCEV